MSRIEPGIYKARAVAGSEQYGETSNGNDQIVLNLTLLESGDTVSTFLVFSDKAAPYSIDRLRKCGWSGADLAKLDGIDANEVDVEVKYEEYKGEMKMKVQIITGGTVTLEKQFDAKGKKAFAAKHAALAKATLGAKPAPKPPVAKKEPQQKLAATGTDDVAGDFDGDGSDDDIPF